VPYAEMPEALSVDSRRELCYKLHLARETGSKGN
jgi:hypothetical protein